MTPTVLEIIRKNWISAVLIKGQRSGLLQSLFSLSPSSGLSVSTSPLNMFQFHVFLSVKDEVMGTFFGTFCSFQSQLTATVAEGRLAVSTETLLLTVGEKNKVQFVCVLPLSE